MTTLTGASRLLALYDLRRKIDAEIKAAENVKRRTRRKKNAAKCGTDGGYYRHLRTTKTKPCKACKRAHADYEANRVLSARINKRTAA